MARAFASFFRSPAGTPTPDAFRYVFAALSGSGSIALQDTATTPAAVALTIGANNASTAYGGALSGAVAGLLLTTAAAVSPIGLGKSVGSSGTFVRWQGAVFVHRRV